MAPYPVDPSQMSTEAGRRMAERFNQKAAANRLKIHRLSQVLSEFLFFKREWQLILAEAAFMWAISSAARHPKRADLEARLYAVADMMYVSTDEAQRSYNESERQQISIAAHAVDDHISLETGPAFSEAARQLNDMADGSWEKLIGRAISPLLFDNLIEHARPDHLQHLIAYCCMLCGDFEAKAIGVQSDVQETAQKAIETAGAITEAIVDAVERGELKVEDGKIVGPASSGDDDD